MIVKSANSIQRTLVPCLILLFSVPLRAETNGAAGGSSDDQMADVAKKLQNPVADLISVPFQNNFDFGGGPDHNGFQYELKFQPVIPITLCTNWNLITRTIVPYIYQHDRIGTSVQSGLADTTLSLFLSPKEPTHGGLTWGIGPDLYFPTATENALGADKWGAGPTVVALWQKKGWTYGALVDQIWSYAGDENRSRLSFTFVQPFLTYTTKKHTTFGVNSESTYDWVDDQWTVPINGFVSQLVKFGKLPVEFEFGGRYYSNKPDQGPNWGLRFQITFVFPK
jgi:hypothetical protein